MNENKTLVQQTLYFCTIKTSKGWSKSKSYGSVAALLTAMSPYLTAHPRTQVNFQTETRWA